MIEKQDRRSFLKTAAATSALAVPAIFPRPAPSAIGSSIRILPAAHSWFHPENPR